MPNSVHNPALEQAVNAQRAAKKKPTAQYYADIAATLTTYEQSLKSTLEASAADMNEIFNSFNNSPITLDSLFKLKTAGKINHTQFLLLTHLSFIQNLRVELLLIKDKGFSSPSTLFNSLKILRQLKDYTTIYEDIAKCDPAAFHAFKLINHYAITPFTKALYDLVKTESHISEMIKSAIPTMTQALQYQNKDANYGELYLPLRDLIVTVSRDALTDGQSINNTAAPVQQAIAEQLRGLATASRAAPDQISSLITDTVIPGGINLSFNKTNIQKLKTHITRLLHLENQTGVTITANLFKTYIELCFPENTPDYLTKRTQALGKINRFISQQRIAISRLDSNHLLASVDNLEQNIAHTAKLIDTHRTTQNITSFSNVTLQAIHNTVQNEIITMQSRGTNSGSLVTALTTVQANLAQITSASSNSLAVKNSIIMIKQLIQQVTTPSVTQQAILNCLTTVEQNIDSLLNSDDAVKNTAKAAIATSLAAILAANQGNVKVIDYIKRLQETIDKLNSVQTNEERTSILGEFVSVNLFYGAYDLASLTLRSTLTAVTHPLQALITRLFTKNSATVESLDTEHSVDTAPTQQVLEAQATSDQLELLTSVLKDQQKKLTKLIRDLNYQTNALLTTQSALTSTVNTGDGMSIFMNQLSAFDINAPMPYQLPDQLKLLNDYDQMLAKLNPIKAKIDSKLADTPDSTISQALKNAYDKFNQNYQAIINKRMELYSNICMITIAELKAAIDNLYKQGKITKEFYDSISYFEESTGIEINSNLIKKINEMGLARFPAIRSALIKLVKIQYATSGDAESLAQAVLKTPEQANFNKAKPAWIFALFGFMKNCTIKTAGFVFRIGNTVINRFRNRTTTTATTHTTVRPLSEGVLSTDSSLETSVLDTPRSSEADSENLTAAVDGIKSARQTTLTCLDSESHDSFKSTLATDLQVFLEHNKQIISAKLNLLTTELKDYKLVLEYSQSNPINREKLQKLALLETKITALNSKLQLPVIDGAIQSRLSAQSDLTKVNNLAEEFAAIKAQTAVTSITLGAVATATIKEAVTAPVRHLWNLMSIDQKHLKDTDTVIPGLRGIDHLFH